MDKILYSMSNKKDIQVTNDGATILRSVGVDNPAAKVLVDMSKVQDDEVGDGTTSVTVLASEILREAEKLIAQKIHPQTIINGLRKASRLAVSELEKYAIDNGGDVEKFREDLMNIARTTLGMIGNKHTVNWSKYSSGNWDDEAETALSADVIGKLADQLLTLPDGFKLHNRVEKIIKDRRKMADGEQPMDWGFAETMAYAGLLHDGFAVRVCGQDARRGTFFHRHATLHHGETGESYTPLRHLVDDKNRFLVLDTLLSEEGVLGFEYGYSTADPDALVVWEAQFGDFANGAQVVIDQFIAAGQAKWGRYCGLTMFLPHGYEGQGPEHSSARLERYLQLCAQNNMQVCVPSTPAQMYHMLRRQLKRSLRLPLIVMTPKSLLRHKQSVSAIEELTEGRFRCVIDDAAIEDTDAVKRVVFCSGKVYYDLLAARDEQERKDVALVRIEQLYPFPRADYTAVIERYAKASDIVWCQEEPENQGAWYQIKHRLQVPLGDGHTLRYSTRPGSPSTAVGYPSVHKKEQEAVVDAALNGGAPVRGA